MKAADVVMVKIGNQGENKNAYRIRVLLKSARILR